MYSHVDYSTMYADDVASDGPFVEQPRHSLRPPDPVLFLTCLQFVVELQQQRQQLAVAFAFSDRTDGEQNHQRYGLDRRVQGDRRMRAISAHPEMHSVAGKTVRDY